MAQKACGVIIGQDYPKPIVPLKNKNIEKFKNSMAKNKFKIEPPSPAAKKRKFD